MKRYLLLGAGFSRNWGAPLSAEMFGHLLAYPAIGDHSRLRHLLIRCQSAGGFEQALTQLQFNNGEEAQQDRRTLETVLSQLFDRINFQLSNLTGIEFQQNQRLMVRDFLGRFDAIFTLNQDTLLERHYVQHVELLGSPRAWNQASLPYMRPLAGSVTGVDDSWATQIWVPDDQQGSLDSHSQPIYKLHGSANWRTTGADQLMILGGAKASAIQQHDVLRRYFEDFRSAIRQADARLCIIGYGFGDTHINAELIDAMQNTGLKSFLVDTAGIDAYRRTNSTHGAAIRATSPLEEAFNTGLRGTCSRRLREIFGSECLEHNLLLHFVEPRI